MEKTFIKTTGTTQNVVIKNGKTRTNGVKWDAKYNGENAKIKFNLNDNGRTKKYVANLDNEDLANILNVPSVDKPIHNRILEDSSNDFRSRDYPMLIEIDNIKEPRNSFEDLIIPFIQPRRRHRSYKKKHRSYKKRRPKTYRVIKIKK